jgi:protein-tyrosine phosphatase
MIDLHCHMLPGIDDGAADLSIAIHMAQASVADGVSVVACTPHILPGLYHNTGPQIRKACNHLQGILDRQGIALKLVPGADNHIVTDFVVGLRGGRLLTLADSRYVLVEPPHHIAPIRLEELFFELLLAGYVPILTHPERLSWIKSHYTTFIRLARAGVWMQITASSLIGAFGRSPRYWAERMLDEGYVHILATDAHDVTRRPPNLRAGFECAVERVGCAEAENLVLNRPMGVIANEPVCNLPPPLAALSADIDDAPHAPTLRADEPASALGVGGLSRGLRRLFEWRPR